MHRIVRTTALLALTAVTAHAQRAEGRNESTWSTRQALGRDDQLKLVSPNGSITITEGRGDEVQVRAEKRGGRVDDIAFKVRRVNDDLVICAVYDDDDDCLADGERGQTYGRSGWNGRQRAAANFTVELPVGARVKAVTGSGRVTIDGGAGAVNATTGSGDVLVTNTSGRVTANTGSGDITVERARGPVKANTGSGDVIVSTASGPVSASTGSGDITATMQDIRQEAEMRFTTGSGNIVLAVPSRFGAELQATTGSGRITAEIPVRVEGRVDRSRLQGILGDGGERLAMSTGSGDITIRRAR